MLKDVCCKLLPLPPITCISWCESRKDICTRNDIGQIGERLKEALIDKRVDGSLEVGEGSLGQAPQSKVELSVKTSFAPLPLVDPCRSVLCFVYLCVIPCNPKHPSYTEKEDTNLNFNKI